METMTVNTVEGKKFKKGELPVGSQEWAAAKRKEAKRICDEVHTQYFDLARVLWEVYDTPIDNNPANQPIYTLWGYSSFEVYAEEELGLQRGKAYSLRKIWYRIEVDLKEMEAGLKKRLISLGWTRARELTRVLTLENAQKWIEFAEKNPYNALEKLVKNTLDDYKKKKLKEQDDKTSTSVAGASFLGEEDSDVSGPVEKEDTDAEELLPSDGDVPTAEDGLPEITDTMTRRTFAFYPDQAEIVNKAVELAMSLAKTDVQSHALSMICMEFLASNDATARAGKSIDWKLKLLAQCEALIGVDLMAVDPKSNEIVYASKGFKERVKH